MKRTGTGKDQSKDDIGWLSWPAWPLAAAVILCWVAWFIWGRDVVAWKVGTVPMSRTTASVGMDAIGQFGDMFGVINTAFTALAFIAVAWSALLQRRTMLMQRDELEAQLDATKDQHAVLQRQAFESTFFQMIEMCRSLRQAVWEVGIGGKGGMVELGSQCAQILAEERQALDSNTSAQDDLATRIQVGDWYEASIYRLYRGVLGPYFRSLYHLFKLVDSQDHLSVEQRRQYSNIARAHMSADDLVVLALNGCSLPGAGFRPYIERFGLLKHLELKPVHVDVLRRFYADSAFTGAEVPSNTQGVRMDP